PCSIEALSNRGKLNLSEGKFMNAERDLSLAISLDSDCAVARYNRGLLYLLIGRWGEGWDDFQSRWLLGGLGSSSYDHGLEVWPGPLTSKRNLLVWGEQGLGDQVLFSHCLTDLTAIENVVVIEIDPRLVSLFQRSFPDVSVVSYGGVPKNTIDTAEYHVPIGSLGSHLRRSVESYGIAKHYLKTDPILVEKLRKRYAHYAKGRRIVGLSWNSINPDFGRAKSLSLEKWSPILGNIECMFISVQYGNVKDEVYDVAQNLGIDIIVDEDIDYSGDLDEVAAQIQALDLLICTSGTAAHIGGAIGQSVWVMVPKVPEWRWGAEADTVAWYPNIKIFRQTEDGDWSQPIHTVSQALRKLK
ncbi:MAG: hypothetical protein CMM25_03155, partial [Rhodospirillaceae bacterium]|nr:hypothetical protein [Rhodospirillaceae bacterium]